MQPDPRPRRQMLRCPVCRKLRARQSLNETADEVCLLCQVGGEIERGLMTEWVMQAATGENPGPWPAIPRAWSNWSARDPGGFTAYLADLVEQTRGRRAAREEDVPDVPELPFAARVQSRVSRWLWGPEEPAD
jgi:hypothetical protein